MASSKLNIMASYKKIFMCWYNLFFWLLPFSRNHYSDVIMSAVASQITSLTIVYSIVHSGADQRKHQSSASLAFVREFTGDRWIPRTKGQWHGICFHLMMSSWYILHQHYKLGTYFPYCYISSCRFYANVLFQAKLAFGKILMTSNAIFSSNTSM